MAISVFEAAKEMCKASDWTISNLQLQKMLYMASLIHAGRTGERLINEDFQAWSYGPVVPELYREVKIFGNKPIKNIFNWRHEDISKSEKDLIVEIYEWLKNKTPGQLVAMTHKRDGAWAKHYNSRYPATIPFSDIYKEYMVRNAR